MLGWTEDQSVIDSFVFDEGARVNSVEYNPNIDFLNNILQNEWDHKGIYLGGFVHSHPGDYNRLSPADIEYSMRILFQQCRPQQDDVRAQQVQAQFHFFQRRFLR